MIVLAYFLLNIAKIDSKSLIYLGLNAKGAIFVIVSLVDKFNFAALVLEVFWLGISLYGIYKLTRGAFKK